MKKSQKKFWTFTFARGISLLGDLCASTALSWWLLEETGSIKTVSLVLTPAMFVGLFAQPFLGPIGDMFDRKKLLIGLELLDVVVFSSILLMIFNQYFSIVFLTLLYSVSYLGSSLYRSTSSAFAASLLDKKDYQESIGKSLVVANIFQISGGLLAGLALNIGGVAFSFLCNIGTFLFSIILLSFIKIEARTISLIENEVTKSAIKDASSKFERWKSLLLTGFSYISERKTLFSIILFLSGLNLLSGVMAIYTPYMLKEVLNMPAWSFGVAQSMLAVGGILAGFSMKWFKRSDAKINSKAIYASLFLWSVGFLLMTINSFYIYLFALVLFTYSSVTISLLISTSFMLNIPDNYRSRVSAVNSFLTRGGNALGSSSTVLLQFGAFKFMGVIALGSIVMAHVFSIIKKQSLTREENNWFDPIETSKKVLA